MTWTLDFEASGLNMQMSYPIEVGYTNGVLYRDTLIKPEPDWVFWSWESELIHHISRKDIEQYGKDAYDVCVLMNNDLAGQDVFVDGYEHDLMWCQVMFAAVDLTMKFNIVGLPFDQATQWFDYKKTVPTTHRALADATQMWRFLDGKQK